MTRPSLGLLAGNASKRTLTSKPAASRATVAESWVRLTTGGTGTGAGPLETTIVTSSPGANSVRDSGSVLMTMPSGTSSLCSSSVVARQPNCTTMFMASSTGRSARSGIRSTGGPVDTNTTMRAPGSTGEPAGGFCSMTWPIGTTGSSRSNTSTTRPMDSRSRTASAWASPTTSRSTIGPVP